MDESEYDKIYAQHGCVEPTASRALLARPGDSAFWCELIVGCRGTLIVHGDGPDIIFRTWRHSSSTSLLGLCRFAAEDSIDYVAEKVAAGARWEYDLEAARVDLRGIDDPVAIEMALEATNGCDDVHEFQKAIAEAIDDAWEWAGDLGRRPSFDLLHARAACRRFVHLVQ